MFDELIGVFGKVFGSLFYMIFMIYRAEGNVFCFVARIQIAKTLKQSLLLTGNFNMHKSELRFMLHA
jgi:hypothetical protein